VLAISTLLLGFIQEVWLNSRLEYSVAYQGLRELKSRYSARSGVELSLLNVYIYKEVAKRLEDHKEIATVVRPYVDLIWSTPFIWPLPIPKDLLNSDQKSLQETRDNSFLKESYNIQIYPEDSRLDVNDLSVSQNYLRQFTFDTLLNLLILLVDQDSVLKEKYSPSDLREILNNISDWTDSDNESQNGGSEETIEANHLPLNRSFIYIEEIQKVPGVTKEIYQLLKPHITVYGSKGLNLNHVHSDILRALNMSEVMADEIYRYTQPNREESPPFQDIESFCNYLRERASVFCENLKNRYGTLGMLQFNTVSHFRIEGLAQSHKVLTSIEALIYDPLKSLENYKKSIALQKEIQDDQQDIPQEPQKTSSKPVKKQKLTLPRSVAPLPFFIMYWKEHL